MPWEPIVLHQADIGLVLLLAGGAYLLAILVPLSARASLRSRLLLGTGFFARLLSGLLFSVPGTIFNFAVLLAAVGGAVLWALEPIPRLYRVEPVAEHRLRPGNERLVLFVGGWAGSPSDRRLLDLLAEDPRFRQVDLLAVDYVEILAGRRPRLIALAQELYGPVRRRLADPKYRAVVLVGHSVGGLLARWWAAPSDGGPPPRVAALVDLAVPKAGADRPALAAALGLPPELLADLDGGAGFVGGAVQRWQSVGDAAGSVFCFRGEDDLAVPRGSAFAGCARRHDEIGADHRTVAAPASAEALAYQRAAELIAEALFRNAGS